MFLTIWLTVGATMFARELMLEIVNDELLTQGLAKYLLYLLIVLLPIRAVVESFFNPVGLMLSFFLLAYTSIWKPSGSAMLRQDIRKFLKSPKRVIDYYHP